MADYLYNGIQLPELPSWDKTKYPYAYIMRSYRSYLLQCVDVRVTANGNQANTINANYVYYRKEDSGSTWESREESSGAISFGTQIIWTNTDILNEDDTVYLAASTPIPVGMTNFDQGLILGLTMPWWGSVGEKGTWPEGWVSYNGLVRPVLPTVDSYPYVYMRANTPSWNSQYDAIAYAVTIPMKTYDVIDNPSGAGGVLEGLYAGYEKGEATHYCFKHFPGDDTWTIASNGPVTGGLAQTLEGFVWANETLYNLDGSVFLAASSPVRR